jgi:dephospho-CoA kinase
MLIIGLTGGIGSGKSTVAELFAEKGIPILDADLIARELTRPGQAALQAIKNHFGADAFYKDGTLNRSALRTIVFNQPSERQWLEQLLHPLIRERITDEAAHLARSPFPPPYCIVVIPLLLETQSYPFINRILVVDAPEHLQLERIMSRDQASVEDAKAIIATQLEREKRLAHANDIILNEGGLTDLIPQVDKLHTQYGKFSKNS